MSRLPVLSGKQLLYVLLQLGFESLRVKGSHHFLRHPDGRTTVVPIHAGETIGPARLPGPSRLGRLAGRQQLKGALIRLFKILYSLYGIAHATVFATCGAGVLVALIRLSNLWLNGRLADQTRLPPEPPGTPARTNHSASCR